MENVKNEELCRSVFELLAVRNRKQLSHCMPALLNCDYLLGWVENNSKAESEYRKKEYGVHWQCMLLVQVQRLGILEPWRVVGLLV